MLSRVVMIQLDLNTIDLNTVGTLLTGCATVILAIIIFFQIRSMQRQVKLAYLPSLTPRYTINQNDPTYPVYLLISNVGQGSAVDIKLIITNLKDNQSTPFSRYAIQPTEERDTPIQLIANSLWKITGSYLDTTGKKHEVDIEFEYPPKIIKFRQ